MKKFFTKLFKIKHKAVIKPKAVKDASEARMLSKSITENSLKKDISIILETITDLAKKGYGSVFFTLYISSANAGAATQLSSSSDDIIKALTDCKFQVKEDDKGPDKTYVTVTWDNTAPSASASFFLEALIIDSFGIRVRVFSLQIT